MCYVEYLPSEERIAYAMPRAQLYVRDDQYTHKALDILTPLVSRVLKLMCLGSTIYYVRNFCARCNRYRYACTYVLTILLVNNATHTLFNKRQANRKKLVTKRPLLVKNF